MTPLATYQQATDELREKLHALHRAETAAFLDRQKALTGHLYAIGCDRETMAIHWGIIGEGERNIQEVA